MTSSTTFVSALLTNINGYRSIEKYVEYGKKLIALPINKVIFIEHAVHEEHFSEFTDANTTFIFIEKKDLYLYQYADQIVDFCPNTDNPEKDTLEYMFVQCNKTEWLREAIDRNPYGSKGPSQFVWIDFGIWHMIRDDQVFTDFCMKISQSFNNRVRIACGNSQSDLTNLHKTISWFFLGSIFGGDRDSLLKFANSVKNKCIETIQKYGTIMWEINVWQMVYADDPSLFLCYGANHDASILQNY
jgi:uncharacterized protein YneR